MILGLDIATNTGYAFYDGKNLKDIRSGHFKVTGEEFEHRAADMARQLRELILRQRESTHFCLIERPHRHIATFKKAAPSRGLIQQKGEEATTMNAGTALMLNQLAGAAAATLMMLNIHFAVIAPQAWRPMFFGRGVKAADWKRAARDRCRALGIEVKTHDEAEAVAIAAIAQSTPAYKEYRYLKSKKVA
jgi:hypothetical protein